MAERVIEVFHGTFMEKINDIFVNGFKYKHNIEHWLGQGFYFYTEFELAKWWSEKKVEYEKVNNNNDYNVAVIKADIIANTDNILNLDIPKELDYFVDFIKDYLKLMKEDNLSIKFDKNKSNETRCFFLDIIKKERDLFVIIKTFEKENPTYGKYNLRELSAEIELGLKYKETQICVSRNKLIYNKKCEYAEENINAEKIVGK